MKLLLKIKGYVRGLVLAFGASLLIGQVALLPHVGAASCASGEQPAANGQCCASGQVLIPSGLGADTYSCCPVSQIVQAPAESTAGTPTYCGKDHNECPAQKQEQCLFDKYLNPAIRLLSGVVGVVVVIAIIWGGILIATSASDPQKVAEGRKRIIGALTGLAIYFLLYSFLQFLLPGGLFNGQ